ncbi:DUF1592 domain-containing protein [Novosphingobium sp. ZW T3_23]|uniref:DUF1592 domain-containing protein n=1 Tax=Novosphingobium sp. ZW T3_23 TaxID=3378084 RepID=UPI003852C4C6
MYGTRRGVAAAKRRLISRSAWLGALAIGTVGLVGLAPAERVTAQPGVEAVASGSEPGFRRLSEAQYLRAIDQAFGAGIKVPGRFEPPLREAGLLAVGAGHVTVTPSGVEQYELRAREISAQMLAPNRSETRIPCTVPVSAGFDRACAQTFFADYGRQLYRRPISETEMTALLALSAEATRIGGSFRKGLEIGLARMLISPNFIFRVERAVPDARQTGAMRLDDYSLATRISFLLWDAPPDRELLDAAGRGNLSDPAVLGGQVDRLLGSPRFEDGVRAFFSDMMGYDQFQGLAKDQALYPKFNSDLANDAREQTLRTLVQLLITENGDYRDLFTTRKTFMNRSLGALYKVPVDVKGMSDWAPYTFPQDSHRGGILSLAGFLMLDPTHEGRSSPTIRGKSVREQFLCQPVPQPPPNVDFAIVQDVSNPLYKTARQRLTVHQENPACAGCHALTDPIGLSIENFDALGDFRSHENDAVIDASGTFDGKPYVGLSGLSQALHDSPDVPSCLVQRVYEYGTGREASPQDSAWLEQAIARFGADGYRVPGLMRAIAISPALSTVRAPAPAQTKVAVR